jgi:DNA adenine methylase
MQYFGGKQRIAARIVEAMAPAIQQRGSYVEPFVGGAAVMSLVECPERIGGDANRALITMWRFLAQGWEPPTHVTEAEYQAVQRAKDENDPMTAFVGFGCSFAGKWFGGYARGGKDRNYAANAASSPRRKQKGLAGVQWVAGDYRACPTPFGAVIYCDPPYAGTTQYGAVPPFDWPTFWTWCQEKVNQGHMVFVSEYAAPTGFTEILTVRTQTDIRTRENGKETRLEKLFVPTAGRLTPAPARPNVPVS